jgi:hypothetical protein
VTLDLQQDRIAVLALLKESVREYSAKNRATTTAGSHRSVTRIDLTFSLGDGDAMPWVHLNFDTKPGAEPDGSPTHPGFAKLEREPWLPAVQAVCDGEHVTVVGVAGQAQECDDAGLGQEIGRLLVSTLLEARSLDVFASLPKADRCEMGVEDPTTGEFGWPNYEDRGKANLA